jgi:hypothetical protein
MLMAVKLVDVIVTLPGSIDLRVGFPLKECRATVVNNVPDFRPICGHCDIFAAGRWLGATARPCRPSAACAVADI